MTEKTEKRPILAVEGFVFVGEEYQHGNAVFVLTDVPKSFQTLQIGETFRFAIPAEDFLLEDENTVAKYTLLAMKWGKDFLLASVREEGKPGAIIDAEIIAMSSLRIEFNMYREQLDLPITLGEAYLLAMKEPEVQDRSHRIEEDAYEEPRQTPRITLASDRTGGDSEA